MYYAIPNLHIKIEKKNQYEFYINKSIFEVDEDIFIEGSALSRIDTKYNKFLFKINFENLKAIIYCNTDNISKIKHNEILDEIKTKIISTNKNDICYISEKNTESNNKEDVGNLYLIRLNYQKENEINCIIEKIQDESDIKKEENDNKFEYNNYHDNLYDNIQYDIESID
jgi:hypothetical protein